MSNTEKNTENITDNTSENITIEEGFEKLEEIINQMEQDEVSLESSFALYQQGIALVKVCNEKIDLVEKQIKLVEGNEASGEF